MISSSSSAVPMHSSLLGWWQLSSSFVFWFLLFLLDERLFTADFLKKKILAAPVNFPTPFHQWFHDVCTLLLAPHHANAEHDRVMTISSFPCLTTPNCSSPGHSRTFSMCFSQCLHFSFLLLCQLRMLYPLDFMPYSFVSQVAPQRFLNTLSRGFYLGCPSCHCVSICPLRIPLSKIVFFGSWSYLSGWTYKFYWLPTTKR